MAGGKAPRAGVTGKESLGRALAALADQISAAAEDVCVICINVSYVIQLGAPGLETRLAVILVPPYRLARPGIVNDEELSTRLTEELDRWLGDQSPAPGEFQFGFRWWDHADRMAGEFAYP